MGRTCLTNVGSHFTIKHCRGMNEGIAILRCLCLRGGEVWAHEPALGEQQSASILQKLALAQSLAAVLGRLSLLLPCHSHLLISLCHRLQHV